MKKPLMTLKNLLVAFMGAVAFAAWQGIVGNRADDVFALIWPFIQHSFASDLFLWVAVLVMSCSSIGVFIYGWQHNKTLEHSIATAHKMLDLDDSLLRCLATWVPSANPEKQMKRIIAELLRDATTEFDGFVHRAALLLPNASNELLTCWTSYQMPQESIDGMQFYTGKDRKRQEKEGGVAGEVFLNGELRVGHLHCQANGNWMCEDCERYIKSPGRRPYPPYLSFASVPIIGINPHAPDSSLTTCLGVLCFDSLNKQIFDSEESKVVLRTFARRLAAALLIYELYKRLP